MLLYYITDRQQFAGDEAERRHLLLERIAVAARAGVDYIQLREKDLGARELAALAREAVAAVEGTAAKLLVNARVDVALSCGAAGVHLPSDGMLASDARAIAGGFRNQFTIGVSCHTAGEVRMAWSHGADIAVFAPVFEKNGRDGVGVNALREACNCCPLPVFALGGVTQENSAECLEAGAAGVAGIRLFQWGEVARTVEELWDGQKQ